MIAKTASIGLLALLAPLASAVGKARVVNECQFEVTLWSVDSKISGPHTLDADGGSYSETFHRDATTGGIAIKITQDPDGLFTGAPQLNFAYSLDGSRIFYDLSSVFGDAFAGHKLIEESADEDCPIIEWEDGTPPAGSQVKDCTAQQDVTLTLCA